MDSEKESVKAAREDAKRIKVSKNGPYLVSGGVPVMRQTIIADSEGTALEWRDDAKFPLQEKCGLGRCGASKNKPITPKEKQTIIEEACDCPSGRLIFHDKKTGKPIEPNLEKSIVAVEDPSEGVSGPLWVRGCIPVESADGKTYQVRNRITLCRCGKSQNKPFCDSSHYPEAETVERGHNE